MSEPNLNLEELQKEKDRILTEFFKTGRIDQKYFGRTSRTNLNPLKAYIQQCLRKTFLFNYSGLQLDEFAADVQQELFVELSRMPAEKFINLYNTGKVKGSRLIATALRIIILKCFTRSPSGNPNHSLLSKLAYGSAFNAGTYTINPHEIINDEEDQQLIIYDADDVNEFEDQYGFTPEEIINLMTPEERFVFEKLLGKQKKGSPSKADKAEKAQFFETVKKLKAKIEKQKGLDNER